MSGISAISPVSGYSSYSSYGTIASGGAITSASQDAAGLAIDEKTKTQTKELDQGRENLQDAKSVLNIEDGALGSINDYLQSIRELTLRASNATMGDEEKGYIQNQIDQYLQGIDDIANQTSFNEKKLLNGSTENMTIASDGSSTMEISTSNSTVESLGLKGYNITSGEFSLKDIDDAMAKVQSSRTNAGAETNRIDYATNYNSRASLELNGFRMDGNEDRSINALQKLKTKQVLDQYKVMLQKKQQEDEEKKGQMFFA